MVYEKIIMDSIMSFLEIGCCGGYCKTCKELVKGYCPGCKLGYENGKRDINKAKCKMKLCCFKDRQLQTCADCGDYIECDVIHEWFNKKGYQYRKCKESIEYIRTYGYSSFIQKAENWSNLYGKL